jgi:hypothetical protein
MLTEGHITESLLSEPSYFQFEIDIEKLKRYISSAVNQILAELIKAGCKTSTNLLFVFEIRLATSVQEAWNCSCL